MRKARLRNTGRPIRQPPDFVFGIIWPYNFIVLAVAAVINALLVITARASIPAAIALTPYQLWLIAAAALSYSYMRGN